MNMPGFTAEVAVYKTPYQYYHTKTSGISSGSQQGVVMQLRRSPYGGRAELTGFWCEAGCTVGCSILAGPEAILACLELCEMACDLSTGYLQV